MLKQVNVALQVLPSSKTKQPYDIVDKAIQIIKESGIRYRVCPFETVMEGDYDEIMAIIKKVQLAGLDYGADNMISFIKVQIDKENDVTIEDKTGKYD